MSALKEQLVKWVGALESLDKGEYDRSFSQFLAFADNSRLHFNMGMIAIALADYEEAILCFDDSIKRDSYLAVGYFQRGVVFYIQKEYENALEDFQDCYERLRSNSFIDYTQLGLNFILHESHVVFNIAQCFLALGDVDSGLDLMEKSLLAARNSEKSPNPSIIEEGLRAGKVSYKRIPIYQLDVRTVFRPMEENVKNSKKVDYLGKAKVVAGADATDNFAGFSGRKIKEETLGRNYRSRKDDFEPKENKIDFLSLRRPAVERPTIDRNQSDSATMRRGDTVPRPVVRNNSEPSLNRRLPERSTSKNNTLQRPTAKPQPAKKPEDELSEQSSRSSDKLLKVKLYHQGIRMIEVPLEITYKELVVKIRKKLRCPEVFLKYMNDDGEKITMSSNDDLDDVIDLARGSNKIELYCIVLE